ncbi:MAG: IS4 family transposase [Pyrinomonadaceae bacterium]
MKQELFAPETRNRFRKNPKFFTRDRVLNFARVTILILRGHKLSLQNALNKFFAELGLVFDVPTASAYCQARQKISPGLFVHLNEVVRDDFYRLYGESGELELWRGHRLLGADGTYLNLPDTVETRANFSLQTNQHESGQCLQALASVLYDLRNDLALSGGLGPKQAEKNFLFDQHFSATREGDVIVLDRAYADYSVIAFAVKNKRHVVIRFPQKSFTVVNQFWESGLEEQIVRIAASDRAREFIREHELPREVKLRLIKVALDSGEIEVLGTTLIETNQYPREEFKQVYGWRWGEETFFDRFKNIFEVERLSGTTKTAIEQDFYGVILLANLEGILSRGAQTQLDNQRSATLKTEAKVNRAVSYVALVDRVVELLASPDTGPEEVLEQLHHLFQTNPTRHRAGRKFDRPKLKHARKLRFYRYIKRVIA